MLPCTTRPWIGIHDEECPSYVTCTPFLLREPKTASAQVVTCGETGLSGTNNENINLSRTHIVVNELKRPFILYPKSAIAVL